MFSRKARRASNRRRLSLLLACLAIAGCASHSVPLRDARQAYYAGDLRRADELLVKASSKRSRDADVLKLDQAMLHLAAGRPDEAERLLREVRDRFDHLEQKDVREATLSLLTDDTRRAYAGEDYEKVMIRSMLALSNLMRDGSDAEAYCLQVDQKQAEIIETGVPGEEENPKLGYKRVAFGSYLHGVLREASHLHYDDAARSFGQVAAWEPNFIGVQSDLQRVSAGVHSAPDHGVVYVFALVGRGPYKEETAAEATSNALLVADRILSAVGDHTLPPTIAPVKIPRVVAPVNEVDGVYVAVDERPFGVTQTVTNVNDLAVDQCQATMNHTIARAVVRRVVKKATVYTAKDQMKVDNGLLNFAFDAAGVVWEATESADTRCWGLLPAQIQVTRIELPVGTHQLSLGPARGGQPIGPANSAAVQVENGRNTYVLVSYPTREMVGEILTATP
ncbi:MAG: hypothetical protein KDA38_04970 [Planctomycetales bacterium]|nr:hypothetical protein [Planctomycetales bacterium]